MSERTEAEVLLEAFNSFHGNRIADAVVAIARKVRELDAPGHAKAVEEAYERGKAATLQYPWIKPPQPPKPKTAGEALWDAYRQALAVGFGSADASDVAAQAAHEFLSKPKVTAGELARQQFTHLGDANSDVTWDAYTEAFLTLAREHGLLEAGE